MRKMLIHPAFLLLTLCSCYSCKKEPGPQAPNGVLSTAFVSASGVATKPIGVDLRGLQLLDRCSQEICITLGGTVVFYINDYGNINPLGVYNFIFQDGRATTYCGEYIVRLEPFTGIGNTYKLSFNQRGSNSNNGLLALVQISVKENGIYTIRINSVTIECH